MKKSFCACFLGFCLLFLTGCDVQKMSSLRDISKPYAAEYHCKKLQIGGEDMLDRFETVKLNLRYDGKFSLTFTDTDDHTASYDGAYTFDENGVTLIKKVGAREEAHTFPYEKGVIYIDFPLGEKLLLAEFTT